MQHETSENPAARRAPQTGGFVEFLDSKGRTWRVAERERQSHDRRRVKMLIFESSAAVRCVRSYPAEWRHLGPDALEDLSWRT